MDGVVSESRLAQGHSFHPLNGNNDLIHRLRIMQIIMRWVLCEFNSNQGTSYCQSAVFVSDVITG